MFKFLNRKNIEYTSIQLTGELKWVHYALNDSELYIKKNGINFNKERKYKRKFGDGVYVIEENDRKAFNILFGTYICLLPESFIRYSGTYNGTFKKQVDVNYGEIIISTTIIPEKMERINKLELLKENKEYFSKVKYIYLYLSCIYYSNIWEKRSKKKRKLKQRTEKLLKLEKEQEEAKRKLKYELMNLKNIINKD